MSVHVQTWEHECNSTQANVLRPAVAEIVYEPGVADKWRLVSESHEPMPFYSIAFCPWCGEKLEIPA